MPRYAFAAGLILLPAIAWSAQAPGPDPRAYAAAIHSAIQDKWRAISFSDELAPGSRCATRITQTPGGIIVSVDFLADCSFSPAGREAVTRAVHLSEPLPYAGFESVFQRQLSMVFGAAEAEERRASEAGRLAAQRVERDMAESDRRWHDEVGSKRQQQEFARRCSFHLLWNMPKVPLRRPVDVLVTINRAGKVVGVAGTGQTPASEELTAAFSATPPCDPVPAELMLGEETMRIGPLRVGES